MVLEVSRFSSRLLILLLLATVASIVGETAFLWWGGDYSYLAPWLESFNLTRERNLTTFLQALAILWAGLLCFLTSYAGTEEWRGWRVMSLVLTLMAMDEVGSLHERTIPYFRELFQASGLLLYSWVIPGSVVAFFLVVGLFVFTSKLSSTAATAMRQGALLFFFGAISLEMVAGPVAEPAGHNGLLYFFLSTMEELFETLGVLRFCFGVEDWLKGRKIEVDYYG